MSTLEIDGLVKSYGTGPDALEGVSLSLEPGEVLSLLGPSGCGKSTILKCVAGLEDPTDGEIRIDGQVIASARSSVPIEKRNVGLVFQSYALWPHKTVYENVALGLKLRKVSSEEVRVRVMESLAMLEIDHLKDRLPGQISGGQQQRVALSRSLVLRPRLLLFDEPLSNLDAMIRDRVRSDLYDLLNRVKITTLYVTHDRNEAMCMSTRIAVLRSGHVEQVGSGRELYSEPQNSFVAGFVGSCNLIPVKTTTDALIGPDDVPLHARSTDATFVPADDGDGYLAFRPHDVVLGPHPEGINTFTAPITRQTHFGNEVEIIALLGTQKFRLTVADELIGDHVTFHVAQSDAIYLDH